MTELQDLKSELLNHVKRRDKMVSELENAIDKINAEFDAVAVRLNRKIRALEADEVKPIEKVVKRVKQVDMDYIAPEDREHFLQLKRKVKA
jgi:uncharacterized Fe-S cluster-containing radical SAM superfamily enzyme